MCEAVGIRLREGDDFPYHVTAGFSEEFLIAASRDPRFGPEVVRRLRDFLQSADLVKFAAYQPPAGATDGATETARGYIQSDAEAQAAALAEKGKGG